MPITFLVTIWPNPGKEAALTEYEDAVLAFLPDHGARVVARLVSPLGQPGPQETQVIEFSARTGFDSYLSDPRRIALAEARDAAVARTELSEVTQRAASGAPASAPGGAPEVRVLPRLVAPRLENAVVRLEPLALRHIAGLRAAASGARDSYGFTTVPEPDGVEAFVVEELDRAADGSFAPIVQVDARREEIVGHTSFLTPRWWPGGAELLAVEVGSTWLAASAQGTAINTAAKLLLFAHAFETWGVARVDLKTDARNARSRAGIVAVGASFEGVLRAWQPSAAADEDGRTRDTAMHSITSVEWPGVKAGLEARLAAKRTG